MALNAACEGIILLKNEQNTLPIRQPKVIAVIGPTANPAIVSTEYTMSTALCMAEVEVLKFTPGMSFQH